LAGFDLGALTEVGVRVRDIYATSSANKERILSAAGDDYVEHLARAVTGELGGRVGIAPRIFLKKLVADVLDRIDQYPDFDPRLHYSLTMNPSELNEVERASAAAASVDDIELHL
jgi:hypothetical protein